MKHKSVTQVSIEAFVGTNPITRVADDKYFKVPFLPLNAPKEPTPAGFRVSMPLYEHQSRSLYRMLQIEARDENVNKFNFGMIDYISNGGVLADAIGMGKTATMLALIAGEPRDYASGANLLVAPSHLLAQWKEEVKKMIRDEELDIVLGLKQYLELEKNPATKASISNRVLVLVSAEEAIKSRNHYYKYGNLYSTEPRGNEKPLNIDPIRLQEYICAAKFVHKAYCGPLWVTPLHLPQKPWRRVVFEEVQDLVLPGKSARDCFIQLTYRCLNVWLITATPFPGKADSMYANNQLLGFKRLRLLPHDPAFDEIKRKLYLRNCAQVKQQAITDKIKLNETYIPVTLHSKELLLYKADLVLAKKWSEFDLVAEEVSSFLTTNEKLDMVNSTSTNAAQIAGKSAVVEMLWSEQYKSARQSCVHVGISDRVIEREQGHDHSGSRINLMPLVKIKCPSEVFRDEIYHLKRQLAVATKRKKEVDLVEAATRNTVKICRAIYSNAYATVQNCFENMASSGLSRYFNQSGETEAGFRMLYKHNPSGDNVPEPIDLLLFYEAEIEDYILKHFDTMEKIKKLAKIMESSQNERCPRARAVVEEHLNKINECVELFDSIQFCEDEANGKEVPEYGSKVFALVQYLSRLPTIKVVVFTMWDRALRILDKALRKSNISSAVFLQHQSSESKSAHVASFRDGDTQVLILNSLRSASGINLQVASHIIFLDPVGYNPMQASALEQQAIGRVLRMGQKNSIVNVIRFVAEDTIEATLYDDIHAATTKAVLADDIFFDGKRDDAYVCAEFDAPIRRIVRMHAPTESGVLIENEEFQIEGSMSVEEAITHRIKRAQAEGEIFDLTEDAPINLKQQLIAAQEHDISQYRKKRRTRGSTIPAVPDISYGEHIIKNEP